MRIWQSILAGICLGITVFCIFFTIYCGINYFGDYLTKVRLNDRMITIKEEPGLSYDLMTNVVYYYEKNTCMCPYYTKDGNLACYLDGKIIDIKEYEAED